MRAHTPLDQITVWRTKFRRRMNEYERGATQHAVDGILNYETVKYFGSALLPRHFIQLTSGPLLSSAAWAGNFDPEALLHSPGVRTSPTPNVAFRLATAL